jgi:hypothetical protein
MQLEKLTELLRKKHGKELDLRKDVYYLFLADGLFSVYLDEDENKLKVNVEFLPENDTYIYKSTKRLEDLLNS